MNTFYFNTGVRPENVTNFPYDFHKKQGHVIRGTLLIPFQCDAPEKSELLFLCDNPNLPKSKDVIVCSVHDSTIISKFAYFRRANL